MKPVGVAAIVLLASLAWAAQAVAAVAPGGWTPAWTTAPTAPITAVAARVIPAPQSLKGTLRYRVRLNAGGSRLSLRLSNEAGADPLAVGRVSVAAASSPSRVVPVLFGAAAGVEIAPGAPVVSDPVDLTVAAGDQLVVSIFLTRSYLATQSQSANKAEYFADEDRTSDPGAAGGVLASVRPIVSAVFVSDAAPRRAIVAFGDSITDGAGGRQPFVRGWPDVLASRLRSSPKPDAFSVVNAGISGNRLLATTPWGTSALARLDRDVLSLPNVGYVVLLEGVNDIGGIGDAPDAPPATAERIIGAYLQIVARAHQHGAKVIGGTILPFAGAYYFTEPREAVRQQVNRWIRTSGAFDGVVDFDAAMRDPARRDRLLAQYDSGDHLHPSDAGYQAMGEAIDLSLFR